MHAVNVCCYQNELQRLENENETLLLDVEKLEKYLTGLANRTSEKEANLHILAEELQQRGRLDFSFTELFKGKSVVICQAQILLSIFTYTTSLLKHNVAFHQLSKPI